jgi:nucleoside-diphosphate-sugar epimerase
MVVTDNTMRTKNNITQPNTSTFTYINSIEVEQQFLQAVTELAVNTTHVFVTGAGGFLGTAICRLLRLANIKVTGFARGRYPDLEQLGVIMVQGDISDSVAVKKAMTSCDLVFHVAAKAGVWGSKADYFNVNVQGTENIINACKELSIHRLVYTSTPSVTFGGKDEAGIDESEGYAKHFLNEYCRSKAQAEQRILAVSGTQLSSATHCKNDTLLSVALRPHLIWGPNDPHLVPRVLARARAGKLKLVGKQDKLVDTIYIDNAAYAHILAAVALSKDKPACAGKAYFLSNDQPITMADMLNNILHCAKLPPISKRVPSSVAYSVGVLLECIFTCLRLKKEPIMTRFVARQLATSHYFDISAAKNDLGYTPVISIKEGMQQLSQWVQQAKS